MKYTFFSIFVGICSCLFSACTSEYHTHFVSENPQLFSIPNQNFSAFTATGNLWSFPQEKAVRKKPYTILTQLIDKTEHRLWIEIYLWTRIDEIISAIERAKSRGVEVKVLFEPNVYGMIKANKAMVDILTNLHIPIAYSDVAKYRFTHAKFWISDNTYCVSTGNWTKSFFGKNREYVYCDTDEETRKVLEDIFTADSNYLGYKDTRKIPPHVVISPIDSRKKIEKFLQSAEQQIQVYVQTVSDANILNILESARLEGKQVHVCTADNESNRNGSEKFPKIHWSFVKKPYLHAKIVIIDQKEVFLGSQNFTTNSIQNNREIGLLLGYREDITKKILQDFQSDCKN